MRVMLMMKGDPEPGAVPGEELLAAMGGYNDELKEAGLLVDLAGLLPSAEGRRTVFSGPFDESDFDSLSYTNPLRIRGPCWGDPLRSSRPQV